MTTPEFDLGAVDAEQFAKAIAETPDEQLAEGLQSEMRGQMLDEIFSRMEVHFDPTKSQELEEVVHFVITGRADGGADEYQVVIRDDTCKTGKQLTEEPGLRLTLDGLEFLKIVAGLKTGMNLYLEGKLKIDGNMMRATRLAGLFAMPGDGEADSTDQAAGGQ
jgi:putative sterol carrier protein